MPRFHGLKTNFVGGEVSPLMLMRSELQQYNNGAEYMRNVQILPQGGFETRPGTEWIDNVDEQSAGVYSNTRMFSFQFSTEQEYLFVFSHLKVKIYRNDLEVEELVTPYSSDELRPTYDSGGNILQTGIQIAQDLDTMIVFHEDYAPRKIVREGSHTSWSISEFETKNIQRFRFSDGTYGVRYTSGVTISAPHGSASNLTNALDDNPNTLATNTFSNATPTDFDDFIVFQVDLGEVKDIGLVDIPIITRSIVSEVTLELLISDDAANWTRVGKQAKIRSTNPGSLFLVGEYSGRYIAVASVVACSSADHKIGVFNVYSHDVGIDEIQQLQFRNPSSTVKWEDGDTLSLLLQDTETESFAFSDLSSELAANIRTALRNLEAVGTDGVTVEYDDENTDDADFTITFNGATTGSRPWGVLFINPISTEFAVKSNASVLRPGRRGGEPVWSAARGYPRCGLFYQERLWVAGSKALPNYLWATRSQTIDDFNVETDDDDFGIAVPADSNDVPMILYLETGRHLQLFTTSAEFYAPISEVDALTPKNITLRRTTAKGAEPGLGVLDIDGGTFFVQRLGKTLREFLFADVDLAYNSDNVSLLASHLINQPVAMALKRATSTEDADRIFLCNTDGTMTLLTSLRKENVRGFSQWNTTGQFHDVATLLDTTYVAVIRDVDGTDTMMIEKLNSSLKTDSAVYDFALGSPASDATVSHLGDAEVQPILDGSVQGLVTIASNTATFARDAATSYEVGLKWPVAIPSVDATRIWLARTLPIEVSLQDGAMFGKKRRLSEISVRLYNTTGLRLNNNFVSFRAFGEELLDQAITPFTGVKRQRAILGYDHDGQVTLGDDTASQATVLGLSYGVSV